MPSAPELEQAVLGAIINQQDSYWDIADILKPEMFYDKKHQKIYQCLTDMFAAGQQVDLLTVTDYLRQKDMLSIIGGPAYLTLLADRIVTALHIIEHATIIKDKWIQRRMIIASAKLHDMAYQGDIDDLITFSEKEFLQIASDIYSENYVNIGNAIGEVMKEIESVQAGRTHTSGIPSGLQTLDKITGGWHKKNLIILAARPSMGKTAMALQFAYAAAQAGFPAVLFSLEMSYTEIAYRMLSRVTGKSPAGLRSAQIGPWSALEKDIAQVVDLPLYVDDVSYMNLVEFRSKARRHVGSEGVKLIIVDYLQLMKGEREAGGNREQEISSISRTLKATAKELDIPVIACAQLNRAVETRADKRPMLSDLRESGAIEQDADVVIGLTRPEYYHKDVPPELQGVTILDVLKHRSGPVGECYIYHNAYLTQYFTERSWEEF
jgi:replicative DNA helicase